MGAKPGNQNARVNGRHPGMVVRLRTPDVDLLYDFFALEGNVEPTRLEIQDAVAYAIRQVYGRRIEDNEILIV